MAAPGLPQNPEILLCDTCSVLPLYALDAWHVLRELKLNYGVQPAVVEAVRSELPGMQKHAKFAEGAAALQKSYKKGTLAVIDAAFLRNRYGDDLGLERLKAIDELGRKYSLQVGRGEAYTYAAANVLNAYVLSDDFAAVADLTSKGVLLPRPILGTFDLIAFAYHIGCFTINECDSLRQALVSLGEPVPKCFRAQSFDVGLTQFYPRVQDSTRLPIGSDGTESSGAARLYLRPLPTAAKQMPLMS